MKKAYSMALKAKGYTSPNPAVGAIIVKDGIIISRGKTNKPGFDHAEIDAIKKSSIAASGADMYVTLEPCSIYGRTPPCTKAIIKAGIKRVFIGTKDPNPKISGKGIKELTDAGIEVSCGILKEKLIDLNADFFKYIKTGMPFVVAKFAQTIDGKIAADSLDSKWITSEKSRKFVHTLRGRLDAILVGAGTVLADNPVLNVRTNKLPDPVRIILDPRGKTPHKAHVLDDGGKTIFVVSDDTPGSFKDYVQNKKNKSIINVPLKNNFPDIRFLLNELSKLSITSVLVEGGQYVLSRFFEEDLIDKVYVFIAPKILGSGLSPIQTHPTDKISSSKELKLVNQKKYSDDVMISGYIKSPYDYLDI
jgi:diaminohydroxyphosphoribosylaminopyrimidine deaminase/5-amino-6-(5-phosphoribosylamino)uracil reductase